MKPYPTNGDRPFDPEEMRKRAERLIREGKMPSLSLLKDAVDEAAGEVGVPKQPKRRRPVVGDDEE